MKKILLLFTAILSIHSFCFAEDIYVGDNDGMTIYLRTESIRSNSNVTPGIANMVTTITYKTLEIPNEKKLEEVKILCLDNGITHRERDYRVSFSYDRVKKEYVDQIIAIYIDKSMWLEKSKKYTYDQHISNNKVCYLHSDDPQNAIYVNTFKEVSKYYNDHPEIRKVTYSD